MKKFFHNKQFDNIHYIYSLEKIQLLLKTKHPMHYTFVDTGCSIIIKILKYLIFTIFLILTFLLETNYIIELFSVTIA